MTVLTTDNRRSYTGDGSTTVFAFPVFFLEDADVKVALRVNDVETSPVFNTDYTVSGAGNPSGGSVTFMVAPVSGATVVVFNDPALTQTVDYQDNDEFPAETHERALDKLTLVCQRITARLSRMLQYDETAPEVLSASDLIGRVTDAETARDAAQAAQSAAETAETNAAASAASVNGPALRADIDANTASIAALETAPFSDDADAHTAVAADNRQVRRFTATATLSLTAAATLGNGWSMVIVADGGAVTIDPDASETINGTATLILGDGEACTLRCDGTRFFAIGLGRTGQGVPDVVIVDEKAASVPGGTSSAGSYVKRDLNTVDRDPNSLLTLSSSQFSFSADGWVEGSCPAYDANAHQTQLYNVTDGVVVAYGTSEFALNASGTVTRSIVFGPVISGKTYELRHQVTVAQGSIGFGVAAPWAATRYSILKYWRS